MFDFGFRRGIESNESNIAQAVYPALSLSLSAYKMYK